MVSGIGRRAPWLVSLVAWGAAAPAAAQNLDAGKTPAQIFADTCSNCHRSARDLKRPSAGFMREHYTTGSDSAAAMAAYLAGVGTDPRANQQRPPAGPATGAAGQPPSTDTVNRPRRPLTDQANVPETQGATPPGQARRPAQTERPGAPAEERGKPPQGQARSTFANPRRPTASAEAIKPSPTTAIEASPPAVSAEPAKPAAPPPPDFEE
jgi:hypothetical protein